MKERFFILLSFMSLIMIVFSPGIKAMQAFVDAEAQTEREEHTGSTRPAPHKVLWKNTVDFLRE